MAAYKVAGVGEHKKYFDDKSYQDLIRYIFSPEKCAYKGSAVISSDHTAAEEMRKTAVQFGKNSGKRLRHSILSFDESEHITPEQANGFAQEIIQHYAPEFQIVYSVHTNKVCPHIHFVMNQVSYVDGHRYAGKKKDYYNFQRHMKKVTHLRVTLSKDKPSKD